MGVKVKAKHFFFYIYIFCSLYKILNKLRLNSKQYLKTSTFSKINDYTGYNIETVEGS
jgi:hypothetical protein